MFLAVAELRGFRAAARHLGVTPSAVSQAIRSLEERVGAPLFSRTTRSVGLTEAGDRLLAHARPAVDMLTAGLDAASGLGGQISGRLRINVPRPSLPLLVNRLLPDFLDTHPNVHLELVGEDRPIDIVEEGFDASGNQAPGAGGLPARAFALAGANGSCSVRLRCLRWRSFYGSRFPS